MQPSLLEKQPEDENETEFCDAGIIIIIIIIIIIVIIIIIIISIIIIIIIIISGRGCDLTQDEKGQAQPALSEGHTSRATNDVSRAQAIAHRKS